MERVGGGNVGDGDRPSKPVVAHAYRGPPLTGSGKASSFIPADGASSFLGVVDEYDPMCPNEFEVCVKASRERRQRERDDDRRREVDDRDRYSLAAHLLPFNLITHFTRILSTLHDDV